MRKKIPIIGTTLAHFTSLFPRSLQEDKLFEDPYAMPFCMVPEDDDSNETMVIINSFNLLLYIRTQGTTHTHNRPHQLDM